MNDDTANIVMWTSAERPATFIQNEDLTPAEVNRLIGLKAVLPPSHDLVHVPAEVMKATKDGSMLMFTAFGDEATFVYPARPADHDGPVGSGVVQPRLLQVDPYGPGVAAGRDGPGRDVPWRGRLGPEQHVDTPPAAAQSDEEYCKALEAERQKKRRHGRRRRRPSGRTVRPCAGRAEQAGRRARRPALRQEVGPAKWKDGVGDGSQGFLPLLPVPGPRSVVVVDEVGVRGRQAAPAAR